MIAKRLEGKRANISKIRSFDYVSADGFYAGPNEDLSWFTGERRENDELQDFSHLNSDALNILIFGRITYEMMKRYWATPDAMEDDPRTTFIMRESPKIVYSKTLLDAGEMSTWMNVTLLHSLDPAQVKEVRETSARDMTILGSGTILQQFFDLGLLDELQVTVVPKLITSGKTLLSQGEISNLNLTKENKFQNGFVSRTYTLHT